MARYHETRRITEAANTARVSLEQLRDVLSGEARRQVNVALTALLGADKEIRRNIEHIAEKGGVAGQLRLPAPQGRSLRSRHT